MKKVVALVAGGGDGVPRRRRGSGRHLELVRRPELLGLEVLDAGPAGRARGGPRRARGAVGRRSSRSTTRRSTGPTCEGDRECATLTVPVDYAEPGGRHASTSRCCGCRRPIEAQGSLVVNPGGPGAPGTDYAAAAGQVLREPLLRAFDIVGFDPRGTGESSPVDCLSDDDLDAYLAGDPDPDDAAEEQQYAADVRAFGAGLRRLGRGGRPRDHHRGRPRHGRAAGRAGGVDADLPRGVLRHQARARRTPSCSPTGSGASCSTGPSTSRSTTASSGSSRPRASRPRCAPTSRTASTPPSRASSATASTRGWPRSTGCWPTSRSRRCPPAATATWPSATPSTASSRRSTTATTGSS